VGFAIYSPYEESANGSSYSTLVGEPDLAESVGTVFAATQRVNAGDFAAIDATPTAQAITLNAMFTQLAYQTSKMTIAEPSID
jgi:hypothetical protein